jgi:hypothetical protein
VDGREARSFNFVVDVLYGALNFPRQRHSTEHPSGVQWETGVFLVPCLAAMERSYSSKSENTKG